MEVLKLPESNDDVSREALIDAHWFAMSNARAPEERRRHLKAMEEEIKARSPGQVARLRRARGLR